MEQNEVRGARAFKIHERIIAREEQRRQLLAENATDLAFMYDEKLYKDMLGDGQGQWAGYLADIKIFYTRNQVNSYIKIYRKFTKILGVPPEAWVEVPITRLMDMMPLIDANNWEDWMVKGRILTTKDWNTEIRQAKGLLTSEEHEEHDYVLYEICSQCGEKHRASLQVAEHKHD